MWLRFFFLSTLATSCTLYESDGRKFFESNAEQAIREQALETSCHNWSDDNLIAEYNEGICLMTSTTQTCEVTTEDFLCEPESDHLSEKIHTHFSQ